MSQRSGGFLAEEKPPLPFCLTLGRGVCVRGRLIHCRCGLMLTGGPGPWQDRWHGYTALRENPAPLEPVLFSLRDCLPSPFQPASTVWQALLNSLLSICKGREATKDTGETVPVPKNHQVLGTKVLLMIPSIWQTLFLRSALIIRCRGLKEL